MVAFISIDFIPMRDAFTEVTRRRRCFHSSIKQLKQTAHGFTSHSSPLLLVLYQGFLYPFPVWNLRVPTTNPTNLLAILLTSSALWLPPWHSPCRSMRFQTLVPVNVPVKPLFHSSNLLSQWMQKIVQTIEKQRLETFSPSPSGQPILPPALGCLL